MKKAKIAFLFSGAKRQDILKAISSGISPDSVLYGANHAIQQLGSENYSCDFIDVSSFWQAFFKIKKYDVVVSAVGLPYILLQKIFFYKKPSWIFININMTSVLSSYSRYSYKRMLIIQALKRAHFIVCLSTPQKEYLIRQGISERVVMTIPFGTDKNFYTPQDTDKGYILSVGRDSGRDYRTLIDTAPSITAQIIVVASRKNIEGEGIIDIPKNVTVKYDMPFKELQNLYYGALCVVVPLKKKDSFGVSDCSGQTVILDAMASGKAVVVSRKSWTDEYVHDGITGILVDPENADLVSQAISRLLADTSLRKKIGVAGRVSVEERFNTAEMGKRIADLIVKISSSQKEHLHR